MPRMNTPSRIELTFHAALTGLLANPALTEEEYTFADLVAVAQDITETVHDAKYTGIN